MSDIGKAIQLIPDKIAQVSALLRQSHVPGDREEITLTDLSTIEAGNFWLAIVAICHQTSPLGQPPLSGTVNGRSLRGWDYLVAKFQAYVTKRKEFLTPSKWATISKNWITTVFGNSLSDPEGRAALLRDLGAQMQRQQITHFHELYMRCDGRIKDGEPNLLSRLTRFAAYSDPVCKKAYFLLAIMRTSCNWTYRDTENLGPPVDYHEIRGHLRVGTVVILDDNIRNCVESGQSLTKEEDIAIRLAVRDAIWQISRESGIRDASVCHYLFWNVFRSHCTRIDPNCLGCRPSTLPLRYRSLNVRAEEGQCPMNAICHAFRSGYIPLMEYTCNTEFY